MGGAFHLRTGGTWWAICGVLTLAMGAAPGLAQRVELVSQATPGLFTDTAGGESAPSAISADGRYVVFVSKAPNLVPGQVDSNGGGDIFLWDRVTGTTALVSRSASSAARAGNAPAESPSLSADGRHVVFHSKATDLVPSQIDDNDSEDVFLYDRVTGTTQLVSHAAGAASTAGSYLSRNPLISADGRYVAFNSFSSDLVDGLTLQALSVFLYERETGTLSLVSHRHDSPVTGASGMSFVLDISADGSFLAFRNSGTDLVAGQTSSTLGPSNLFLYDRTADTHTLVSHASGSLTAGANQESGEMARLSSDGRYLAFLSRASDLLAGQVKLNQLWDAFLYDRITGSTALVSRSAGSSIQGADDFLSFFLDLSDDGAFVAFVSEASNLVSGYSSPGSSSASNVFLYDRAAGTVALVSHASSSANTSSSGDSGSPSLSANGRYIAFQSTADNLLPGSAGDDFFGGTSDVFLYDRLTNTSSLVSRKHGTPGNPCNSSSEAPVLSADGRFIAFGSHATDGTDARDTNSVADVILYDHMTAGAMLVSRRAADRPTLSADGYSSSSPSLSPVSADGRWITFASYGSNLVPGQIENNGYSDIFLYDRSTGATTLVSRSNSSPLKGGNGSSDLSVVSADGRYVAFYSYASDMMPGLFTVELGQIFLFDRISGTTTLVSRSASAPNWTANRSCAIPEISADGRFVAYLCDATDLVPGQDDVNDAIPDIDGNDDVFLFDHAAGTTTLVSRSAASPFQTGNYKSLDFDLSSDGRYVAFRSLATDLVPGVVDGNGDADVFLFDRVTGTTTLVSRSSATPGHTGNGYSGPPALSDDGRYVAFWSTSTDLVPGHVTTPSSGGNVFLYDRVTGATVLVSHAPGSPTTSPNGSSGDPFISGDGRWVVFSSHATDLVPGQVDFSPSYHPDLFLFDRVTGTVRLVNHTSGSLVTPCHSTETRASSLSADGRYLVFTSYCQDFVPGQQGAWPRGLHIFLYDRETEQIALVDHVPESTAQTGNAQSWGFWISADGGTVVFSSSATDLADGDFNNFPDVFAYLNPLPGRAFHTLAPCRVLDTRQPQDGPALVSGVPEVLSLHGVCGIPATARAVSVNVTVVHPTGAGHLGFSPGDLGDPESTTINFAPGQVRANNAILPLAVNGLGTLRVSSFVTGNGTVHLILDVNGWFE